MLLVTDYARAWQVSVDNLSCFRAVGIGFRETFTRFWSSLPLMLILLVIQILFILFVCVVVTMWIPATGGGVVLLFLVSQFLFIIKIYLKMWRYGSVTALMESRKEFDNVPDPITEIPG
jgi:hypothetical protein